MAQLIDTLLLLALPASGKSEVRRYLAGLTERQCRDEFHIAPTAQLDDFPYVHFMRRIDEELVALGQPRIFFWADDRPFQDGIEWGTLIALINEDYRRLHGGAMRPGHGATWLLERLEAARVSVGGQPKLSRLEAGVRAELAKRLEGEAADVVRHTQPEVLAPGAERTVVIEFARGGADGSSLPLVPPYGYGYSLSVLSEEILSRSAALYIWVTPEESRRKNAARTDPNDPGSILHHGVPIEVMLNEYGCDDMEYLLSRASKPGTVEVKKGDRVFHIPLARFDNRVDKTSFVREPREQWPEPAVRALHEGLKEALGRLVK
ncbi:MAG: hypothetical protein IT371_01710 [Deltaproteobacteria bacterium]|nr:hypothetical protein [Deltaproteobacteria bacterium]